MYLDSLDREEQFPDPQYVWGLLGLGLGPPPQPPHPSTPAPFCKAKESFEGAA